MLSKKIKHTEKYLIVVSDDEIQVGDYIINNFHENHIGKCTRPLYGDEIKHKEYSKVIAHLPLDNAPILEGVDLLPAIKDKNDVVSLAKETTKKYINEREKQTAYLEFIEGHTVAKNKYENDLIEFGRWVLSNPDFAHDSSWSKETASYHLNRWKKLNNNYPTFINLKTNTYYYD